MTVKYLQLSHLGNADSQGLINAVGIFHRIHGQLSQDSFNFVIGVSLVFDEEDRKKESDLQVRFALLSKTGKTATVKIETTPVKVGGKQLSANANRNGLALFLPINGSVLDEYGDYCAVVVKDGKVISEIIVPFVEK